MTGAIPKHPVKHAVFVSPIQVHIIYHNKNDDNGC